MNIIATIKTSIQMHNGMTSELKSMSSALNIAVSKFERLQYVSSNSINTESIQAARMELNRTEMVFNGIENEVRKAEVAQQRLNDGVKNGQGGANGLLSAFKNLASSADIALGARKIIGLSDAMVSTSARLDLMNDGLQSTEQLQRKIFESAERSRGSYLATADAVSELGIRAGDAFSSNDELIAFSEQLNKQFVISGTSAQGIEAAMAQLTQSMDSGVLRGEELNSVFNQAPTIIQTIADYMGVGIGEVRALAQEGEITADIVKNAMLSAADETNTRFESMPMTWAQVWTSIVNRVTMASKPLLEFINLLANNWSTIEPIVLGLAAAIGMYAAALLTYNTINEISALIEAVRNAALITQTSTTFAATAAQHGFNAALLANPITWVIVLIIAITAAIYKWVKSVGGIQIAWQIAMHAILTAWDLVQIGFFIGVYRVIDLFYVMQYKIAAAAVAIQNFVGDMKTGVLIMLQHMVNGAIGIINDFIDVLNKIQGVSIDTIQEVTFGTNAYLENEAAKKAREEGLNNYRDFIEAGIASRDSDLEQMKHDAGNAMLQRQAKIDAAQIAQEQESDTSLSITDDVSNIAGNTSELMNSMDVSEEDLKYIRDLAEREVIDRTVLRDVKLEVSNSFGDVKETADVDGIITKIEDRLSEAIESDVEGDYNV